MPRRVRFTSDPQPSFTEPGDGSGTMPDMTALAPFEADVDPRRVPLDVEIVVPVYNEAAQLAERITALRTFLDDSFPFRTLITVVDNASTDDTDKVARQLAATDAGRRGHAPAPQGPWVRAPCGVVDERRAGRRLHGRRPLDVPLRPPPAGGPVAVRASRRDHRLTAGAGRARGARRQARAHLAGLQPVAQAHAARSLQRCAVRLQGAAPGCRDEAAAARRGQRVVLRHRAAGHGRASGPAHRRGPGGLGRRP